MGVKGWGNGERGEGEVVEQHLPALGGLDSLLSLSVLALFLDRAWVCVVETLYMNGGNGSGILKSGRG